MLLIMVGKYYFSFVSPGTKYKGDPAHNIVAANNMLDHMERDEVIYIISSQLIFTKQTFSLLQ
jgi:hypothetical protein